VLLCAGSLPEVHNDALHNTAVLLSSSGDLLLTHRKVHLYPPAEPPVFVAGDTLASVTETAELGTVGLAVCFDGDFPETARALRLAGADVVLLPAAYELGTQRWWDILYPANALANGQWWIMANQHGGELFGGSQIIAPDGSVAAAAPRDDDSPGHLVATIALRESLRAAAAECEPMLAGRRPALYGALA
jgi:predicted amidohydrolase